MPYTQTKEKGGGYTNTSPHGVKGRHMTKKNADAQLRLLRGIEHNSDFAKYVRGHKGKGGRVARPPKH